MTGALDFMLASRRSELHGLRTLELTCDLVGSISRLIHALQRERGFSNIYLGSHEQRYRAGLDDLSTDSLAMEQRVTEGFARMQLDASGGADKVRLFNRIACFLHWQEGFAELRRRIREQQISPLESTRAFTRPIGSLLNVVFEAADTAVDPHVTRHLVALFNFMQGKELVGQERAAGVAGFTLGYFDAAAQAHLAYLEDAQKRCFDIFCENAEPASLGIWRALCSEQLVVELGRLRQVALRSSEQSPIASPLAEIWFELTSQRIDVMKQLEDELTTHLQALCQRKIRQAEADLDNHRALSKRLASLDDDSTASASRLFNVQAFDLGSAAAEPGGQLNRSLMDVLHEQNLRMQALGVELEEARRSLSERKVIDRAKGLLMKQHGLQEDEAYRLLQSAAMERSQRLAEVAQNLLSYSDLMQARSGK